MKRIAGLIAAVAVALPAVAAACPACATRDPAGPATYVVLGAMIGIPFVITAVGLRVIRRLTKDSDA